MQFGNVRDCASSAKSFVIVFGDRSDVFEKTMKVTVPSLPKENGVPVKIDVILLRFPQANLFLAKIKRFGFHRCFFDAMVRPDCVTSEKAETSVTERKIRVLGWKGIHTNTSLTPKFIITTGTTNIPLLPKFIIILDEALHGYKIRHV